MPALSFEALYGSHNYKLNREDSDVDMMYYYNPSFKDLYVGRMAESNIEDRSSDRKHHDIRKLPLLFYKANVNFLEILYSCQVVKHDGLYDLLATVREDIASMNIPYLFDGCMGMFNRNYQNFQRDAHYVDREDIFDPRTHAKKLGKHASGAYRILDFAERYANQGFKDFGKALAYDANVPQDKAFIDVYMAMRNGEFSFTELDHMLKQKEARMNELKAYFKEQKVKEEVNQFVIETVEKHVKEHLLIQLWA